MNASGRLLALAAVSALSCGCLSPVRRQMSWSGSGDEVSFPIDARRVGVYSLKRNDVRLLPDKDFQTIVWSPTGERLAAYNKGTVYLYDAGGDAISLLGSYRVVRSKDEGSLALLNWHPSGRRLLVSPLYGPDETYEIDVDSRAMIYLGAGQAIFGPQGDWLLWFDRALIGRRMRIVVDRQDHQGEKSFPMDNKTRDLLEGSGYDAALRMPGYAGAALCMEKTDAAIEGRAVVCLDSDGAPKRRLTVPPQASAGAPTEPGGRATAVFVDPTGTRTAVMEYSRDAVLGLRVYDGGGRMLADGSALMRRLSSAAARQDPEGEGADRAVLTVERPDGSRTTAPVSGGKLIGRFSPRKPESSCSVNPFAVIVFGPLGLLAADCHSTPAFPIFWSQDGRWISSIVARSLYLWDWRGGEIRVIDFAPPSDQNPSAER